jgi:probable addiction module antidote protein
MPAKLKRPLTSTQRNEVIEKINLALAKADDRGALRWLGALAAAEGMSKVARQSGLDRRQLYRSVDGTREVKLNTAIKLVRGLGLQVLVSK